MNTKIKIAVGFMLGFAAGVFASYEYLKHKFNDRIDSEIKSVKRIFKNRETKTKANYSKNKPNIDEIIKDSPNIKSDSENAVKFKNRTSDEYINYSNYFKSEESVEEKKPANELPAPYVITPDDFGTMGYSEISLSYYQDGILTEERDEEILPIDETIGRESLNHFGDYTIDTVYVRNERRQTDYEVLRVDQTYTEYFGKEE